MEDKKTFNCFTHHNGKQQAPFKKLSEFIKEELPEINIDDAKKAIIAYRKYMWDFRGNKDQVSNFCDVCYNIITPEESKKTTLYDFNFCCDEHGAYRNAANVELVRHELGITVEHLPMIDIYG